MDYLIEEGNSNLWKQVGMMLLRVGVLHYQ